MCGRYVFECWCAHMVWGTIRTDRKTRYENTLKKKKEEIKIYWIQTITFSNYGSVTAAFCNKERLHRMYIYIRNFSHP